MVARIKSNSVWLIVVVAFLVRLAWVLFSPALPVSDFETFHGLAMRMADAFRPPGYPTFLAVIYWVTNKSLLAAKLANAILATITCWLTYSLARRVFNERVALTAALIVAFFPSQILYTSLLATENLFTPLLLASTLFFLSFLQENRRIHLVAAGILLGLSSLVRLAPCVWFAA